jgi:diacylglycerol O-acyltransferase / wax synthase
MWSPTNGVIVKRLNGWDAMLLYSETKNIPTHTVKIGVINLGHREADFTFDVFQRTLRRRLHLLEPLCYQLVDIPFKLHRPMWRENCTIDFDYHLRRVQVPTPGGRRELNQVIGEIASAPLDHSRPLWEMYFAEGIADNRVAVIAKVHHALADGVASANLMVKGIDFEESVQQEREPLPANAVPSAAQLLCAAGVDHLQQFGRIPRLISDTAAGVTRVRRRSKGRGKHPDLAPLLKAPPTFIGHVVSPRRMFATATLALADAKETSKHMGITINELVLAIAAGALRELLLRYDGRADAPIIASVPASLDTSPDRLTGNEMGGMLVSLPVHIDDPLERVRLIQVSSDIAKEYFHLLGPALAGRWMAYLPPAIAPWAFRWLAQRNAPNKLFNLPISNVPGPRKRGSIAGATLSEIYSVGPLVAGSGMNMTVWSYVDQLNISVLTDDVTLDDPHQATDAMIHAFTEMRSAGGLSAALTKVHTAMGQASAVV